MNSEIERTVSIEEACAILHCGRTTIYNRIKSDPEFPTPMKTARTPFWYARELNAYVAACASRRVPPAPAYAVERAVATEQVPT